MAIFLQDLDQRFPIVDPETGKPTDYFMRLLRGQTGDLATGIDDADTAIAALQARNINTGFGLSGGGNLSADRTIALGNPALTDPGADRGVFWDDSAGQLDWLTFGSGLSVTDQTLTATGGGAAWTLAETTTVSVPTATVPFVGLAGANDIMIVARNVTHSVANQIGIQVSTDNGATYFTTNGDYQVVSATGVESSLLAVGLNTTNATAARTAIGLILGTNVTSAVKVIDRVNRDDSGSAIFVASSSPINAIRATSAISGGNITGGTYYVFTR